MKSIRKILLPTLAAGLAAVALQAGFSTAQPANLVPALDGEGNTLGNQIAHDANTVIRLRMTAKQEGNSIKLSCVNDKLLQVKALENQVDGVQAELKLLGTLGESLDTKMPELRALAAEIHSLAEAAEACVSDELTGGGEGDVDVDGPGGIDDPTDDDPFEGDDAVEPAVFVTPFF